MNSRCFIINGQNTLRGDVYIKGAKNLVNKLLIASLLTPEPCVISNVPNITEIDITIDLCRECGSIVNWDKTTNQVYIHTPVITNTILSQKYSGSNRIPVLLLGVLLNRTDRTIQLPYVGGDAIGDRPVNFHTSALKQLGAYIDIKPSTSGLPTIEARTQNGFIGTEITLSYPSVGATENILFAACGANGKTIIHNAAIEPEIIEIISFLQHLGCQIQFVSDRSIIVNGVKSRKGTNFHAIEDRNVVVSYATAALLTNGYVTLHGVNQRNILGFISTYYQLGGGFKVLDNRISFFRKKQSTDKIHIETNTHPGFMTDWQQVVTVALTQHHGNSTVHETVYENRFGFTKALNKMGAAITLTSECLGLLPCRFNSNKHLHSIRVKGPTPLTGMEVDVPDLRAGFAYVLAGLIAEGTTTLYNADLIDRGYESIVQTLQSLGADISQNNKAIV
jgi:UDP-N-acetylglucosamine 1-carboxyvinyltransferase